MALVFGMFLSCGNTDEEIQQASYDQNQPLEVSEGVTLFFSDLGISKLKLETPLMYRFEQEDGKQMKFECPTGMKVTFYDSIGGVESILTAKYGILISAEEYIQVKDSVVFENFKKERLETELLNIDFKKDSVYTHEKVTVLSPKGTITGIGLNSNSNFTKYKVHNISNGVYEFEDEELEKESENNE